MKQQQCKKAEAQRTCQGPILCVAGFWSIVDLDTFIWPINMLVVPVRGQNHHCGSHKRMKKSHQTPIFFTVVIRAERTVVWFGPTGQLSLVVLGGHLHWERRQGRIRLEKCHALTSSAKLGQRFESVSLSLHLQLQNWFESISQSTQPIMRALLDSPALDLFSVVLCTPCC